MINVKRFREHRDPRIIMNFEWRTRRLLRNLWGQFYDRLCHGDPVPQIAALLTGCLEYFSHIRLEEWLQPTDYPKAPHAVIALEPKWFNLRFRRKVPVVQIYLTRLIDNRDFGRVALMSADYQELLSESRTEDAVCSLELSKTKYFKRWQPYFLWETLCRSIEELPGTRRIARFFPHHSGNNPSELNEKNLPIFRTTYLYDDHFIEVVVSPV